jgi:hypothetical protein
MNWKFWEKKKEGAEGAGNKVKRLSRPKELPAGVGKFLVVNLKQDPDWVWGLRCVMRQREGKKSEYDVRVFDMKDAEAKGVTVRDYASLENHPEAILFQGWFDKATHRTDLHRNVPAVEKGAA